MRQNWLSNRIFKSSDDIVDHCCYDAWNTLIDQPWKIMSIAAAIGQPQEIFRFVSKPSHRSAKQTNVST